MKFSDYIRIYSHRAYLTYCKQNYLTPIIDVELKESNKICWLLKPEDHENLNNQQYKQNG